jgi:hypothetical protein
MRRLQCVQLVPAALRALPRVQLLAGTSAAFVVLWLLAGEAGVERTIVALQYAALMLSLAVATILDEPAGRTVAAVPPPLIWRRGLTIVLVLPGLVLAWAALVALGGVTGQTAAALTLQLAALVLLTFALGARLTSGGAVAGPLVALAFLGGQATAPAWVISPDFGEWRWDALWAGLAAGALLGLALASRDPACRPAHGRVAARWPLAPRHSRW